MNYGIFLRLHPSRREEVGDLESRFEVVEGLCIRCLRGVQRDPSPDEMRARVAPADINQKSLLAMDYLNHFSEVAMNMETLSDMPAFVEDIKS